MPTVLYVNMKIMRIVRLMFIVFSGYLMTQCNETEKVELKLGEDYLPLIENSKWEYLNEYFSTADASLLGSGTLHHVIKGDTILDGIHYRKVVDENGNLVKVLRKDGSKYYGRNHELYGGFSKEYLFLDEAASLNGAWEHIKIGYKTAYKVIGLNTSHTIQGVDYHDVMELQVNYYYQEGEEFKLNYSTLHYYAKGIGEIYTFYPYPSNMYADVKISLMKYVP